MSRKKPTLTPTPMPTLGASAAPALEESEIPVGRYRTGPE